MVLDELEAGVLNYILVYDSSYYKLFRPEDFTCNNREYFKIIEKYKGDQLNILRHFGKAIPDFYFLSEYLYVLTNINNCCLVLIERSLKRSLTLALEKILYNDKMDEFELNFLMRLLQEIEDSDIIEIGGELTDYCRGHVSQSTLRRIEAFDNYFNKRLKQTKYEFKRLH